MRRIGRCAFRPVQSFRGTEGADCVHLVEFCDVVRSLRGSDPPGQDKSICKGSFAAKLSDPFEGII